MAWMCGLYNEKKKILFGCMGFEQVEWIRNRHLQTACKPCSAFKWVRIFHSYSNVCCVCSHSKRFIAIREWEKDRNSSNVLFSTDTERTQKNTPIFFIYSGWIRYFYRIFSLHSFAFRYIPLRDKNLFCSSLFLSFHYDCECVPTIHNDLNLFFFFLIILCSFNLSSLHMHNTRALNIVLTHRHPCNETSIHICKPSESSRERNVSIFKRGRMATEKGTQKRVSIDGFSRSVHFERIAHIPETVSSST